MNNEELDIVETIVCQNSQILDIMNPYTRGHIPDAKETELFGKAEAAVKEIIDQNRRILDMLAANEADTEEHGSIYTNPDIVQVGVAPGIYSTNVVYIRVTCTSAQSASLVERDLRCNPMVEGATFRGVIDVLLRNGPHKKELLTIYGHYRCYKQRTVTRRGASQTVWLQFAEPSMEEDR